jgi:hypothetical protein
MAFRRGFNIKKRQIKAKPIWPKINWLEPKEKELKRELMI